jgi:hypothetical protein
MSKISMPADFFTPAIVDGRMATVTLRFAKETPTQIVGKDMYGDERWFTKENVMFRVEPVNKSHRLVITCDVKSMKQRQLVS